MTTEEEAQVTLDGHEAIKEYASQFIAKCLEEGYAVAVALAPAEHKRIDDESEELRILSQRLCMSSVPDSAAAYLVAPFLGKLEGEEEGVRLQFEEDMPSTTKN